MEEEEELLPECPVCLQPFDESIIVPRVLACGHSVCQPCLVLFLSSSSSSSSSSAVKCPACTQLVPLPKPVTSLPKNIDLLRLIRPSTKKPNGNIANNKKDRKKLDPISRIGEDDYSVFRSPWGTDELFFTAWKTWVLPQNLVLISREEDGIERLNLSSLKQSGEQLLGESISTGSSSCGVDENLELDSADEQVMAGKGNLDSGSLEQIDCLFGYLRQLDKQELSNSGNVTNSLLFFKDGQKVKLLPFGLGSAVLNGNSTTSGGLKLSYVVRVMRSLRQLGDSVLGKIRTLLYASWRCRKLCRIYGFWLDYNDAFSPLFLVCEKSSNDLWTVLSKEETGRRTVLDDEEAFRFGKISMELCEAVMALHSEGVVCGCLAPSCFRYDEFGHSLLDVSSVLITCKGVQADIEAVASDKRPDSWVSGNFEAFASPEAFLALCSTFKIDNSVSYSSDVWSIACIISVVLLKDLMQARKLYLDFCRFLLSVDCSYLSESISSIYESSKQMIMSSMEDLLEGTRFDPLVEMISSCLDYDPLKRPSLCELWNCIRSLHVKCLDDVGLSVVKNKVVCCLLLSEFCFLSKSSSSSTNQLDNDKPDASRLQQERKSEDLKEGLSRGGPISVTLNGHRDCVTRLAIGGGYLFSASYDKTINVWSLQDFTLVHTLRGHEHRITAMVVVDSSQLLCISGDSGAGIFQWDIGASPDQGPLKKWYEHNDWRFSGIYSLAVSESGFLYSGSGDKTIKAWSLQDYSLSHTMTGHKSFVSCLAVGNGILYSGSWDGSVRLWWLHDHSPLVVLGHDAPEKLSTILSLVVSNNLAVASCENGTVKIWRDNVLVKSAQIHKGSIFALHMHEKWLFTGGFDKIISIQELMENDTQFEVRPVATVDSSDVVTSLLYWQGKLFVGSSGKDIKVYSMLCNH